MRSFLFFVAMMNTTALFADPSPGPRERPRITEKIKLEFKERESKDSPQVSSASESDTDVVELDSIQVFAQYRYFVFDSEKRILEDKPFTWKDGGTFSRHVGKRFTREWKIQYDPKNNVVKFFSLSF